MMRFCVLIFLSFVILGSNPLQPLQRVDMAYAADKEKEKKPDDKKESDHAKKDGGEEVKEGDDVEAMKNAIHYVEMDPLILPVIDKNGISQTISIVVGVEVFKESQIDEVKDLRPRLKDIYLRKMYGMFSANQSQSSNHMLVNPIEVKDTLLTLTTEILGEEVVKDVLIQVISQRPV